MATVLKVKRLHESAEIPFKTFNDDFCYDCRAVSEKEVHPNVWQYGLGIAIQTASDFDGSSVRGITLRSRSSIYKTGMVMANGVGTVDIDEYTGEILVTFYHVIPTLPRYKVGDKVCQLHLDRTEAIEFLETSELRPTRRGAGGHGSTGK